MTELNMPEQIPQQPDSPESFEKIKRIQEVVLSGQQRDENLYQSERQKLKDKYDSLPPKEKFAMWKRAVNENITRQGFYEMSPKDRSDLIAEYNQLVRECFATGESSEQVVKTEEDFAATLRELKVPDIKKLRNQLKI